MAITQLSSTLGYNQWVEPKAMKCGSDVFYSGIKSSNGYPYVGKLSGGSTTLTNLETSPDIDDHNAPAVLARSGKPVLAAWSRHNASAISNLFIAPAGTVSFVDKGNLSWSGNSTYNQWLDYQDEVYLLTRMGSGQWGFRHSASWPTTTGSFDAEIVLLNFTNGNPYPIFRESSTAGVWHIAIAPNPDNSDTYLKYGQVDLSTGDISSAGSVIANMDGTNLPLDENDFQELEPVQRSDQRIRLWDVTDIHSKILVGFSEWEDDSTTGNQSRLKFAIIDPSDWSVERKDIEVGQGKVIYAPQGSHYEGGMAFNRNGSDTMYVCWESSGTWRTKVHTIASDFTVDAGTSLDSVADTTAKLIRPVAVQGADQVMYEKATSYTSFNSWSSSTYLADG